MAKKKKAAKKSDPGDTERYIKSATNRRGDVTPEMLQKQSLRLVELSGRLSARAAQMKERSLESLRIDGHRKFAHGQEKIEAYLAQIDKNYHRTVHAAEVY